MCLFVICQLTLRIPLMIILRYIIPLRFYTYYKGSACKLATDCLLLIGKGPLLQTYDMMIRSVILHVDANLSKFAVELGQFME